MEKVTSGATFPNLHYFVHIAQKNNGIPIVDDSDDEDGCSIKMEEDYDIYVASIGLKPLLTLKIHHIVAMDCTDVLYDVLGILNDIETVERSLDPLNWRMRVQCSSQLETFDQLKFIFQCSESPFGVWGQEQVKCLSRFTTRAVDISSHVLELAMQPSDIDEFDPEKEQIHASLSITDLFVEILRKHAGDFSDLQDEAAKKDFERWIRDVAWKAFVVRDDTEYELFKRSKSISNDSECHSGNVSSV